MNNWWVRRRRCSCGWKATAWKPAPSPGPRGAQAIVLAAKVRALLEGRYNVSFDDVRKVYLPALRHTYQSEVNLSKIPSSVRVVRAEGGRIVSAETKIRDADGDLFEGRLQRLAKIMGREFADNAVKVEAVREGGAEIVPRTGPGGLVSRM